MRTAEIRRRFLQHFERTGHQVVPSASLILDDPNLLFVNAGMVPFKPYLLGQLTPESRRATSVQKCLRTPDIDEVGKTSRHATFFQMNGNFSFGDYFKEGAIDYAWDLITRSQSDGGFGFDESKLWATVYHDDDEAYALWRDRIGLPESRIVRRGMADNYWSMGVPGPCGPCSEIYIDRGPEYGPEGGPEVDEDRYLEFWNLVFMQYERGAGSGKDDFPILGDLPSKNIDTGLGLERVAFLLQGVDNIYEIDEVYPVIDRAAELTGRRYGADHTDDVRFRVVADHVRTALMVIGDGVTPTNEQRGYVLRRIIRRAVRAMRLLGVDEPVLPQLLPVSLDCMKASYPELAADFGRISSYAYGEEEVFRQTLRAGTTHFDTAVAENRASGAGGLSGAQAFILHDTYGFPIDLTLEMAAEHGVQVDEAEFRRLMQEQRDRAKAAARERKQGHADLSLFRSVLDEHGGTEFTGYGETAGKSRVQALLMHGVESVPAATAGDEVDIVLDSTPFYAEAGGQQADHGTLSVDGGELVVDDVQRPLPGLIVHRARVTQGQVRVGDTAQAEIDVSRRRAVSRAHSATHLVHKAVRDALGDSARQAGSLNAPGRLRFDYTTSGPVSATQLADVEAEVNTALGEDLDVQAYITTLDEARRMGAMALFGEKYGNEVRVVDIGDGFSRELCAGTHVLRSSQLGMVKLINDASIGAGVRRVEALVGADAFDFLSREHLLVSALAETFNTPAEQVPDRVRALLERVHSAEKEVTRLRAESALAGAGQLAARAHDVSAVVFVGERVPDGLGAGELRALASDVRGRLDPARPGVVVLLGVSEDGARSKVSFVVATNETARSWRLAAGDIVQALAPSVAGQGGGRPDLAQGAGSEPGGIDGAIGAAERFVGARVTGSA